MSVYIKLTKARVKLASLELKKTGHNKFSNYHYYELGDFIPHAQKIFDELGLCGVISYGSELATLRITDAESKEYIDVTSPMSEANLKGMHPVQNLGAVQTYIRRYLWTTALEIVEADAIDMTAGSEPVKAMPSAKPVDKPIVKAKVEEKKPELKIDEGMPILQFAEQVIEMSQTMSELKQWFGQLYTHAKSDPETQVSITNLYNARKIELEKK